MKILFTEKEKKFFSAVMQTLDGFLVALGVVVVAYIVIVLLGIDKCKADFVVGWISCMGYYFGIRTYKDRHKQKE